MIEAVGPRPVRSVSTLVRSVVDAEAPPERLATLRILVGVFVVAYLLIRLPVFLQLRERRADGFDGVGVFSFVSSPLPDAAVTSIIVVTIAAGFGFVAGGAFRITGPVFAVGVLLLTSYRSSWGQLLHFEHLFTLHLLVLAVAPAADAYSLDRRRRSGSQARDERPATSYGLPLALCSVILVATYVIAGIAKLRYGGLDWIFGDTLRNHVAYSAARLDVLGGTPTPLAEPAIGLDGLFPVFAAATVAIELGAPVALLGGRLRTMWVVAAWSMHLGIFALMLVGFPYPLFLVAFTPLFRLEQLADRARSLVVDVRERLRSQLRHSVSDTE